MVVVVKDGQVLLEKGYGYADLKTRTPGRPEEDPVPAGLGLQALHLDGGDAAGRAGKINLDADVNQYLDFKIPPRDGKPVTMRNIMTHTPGFEEQIKGLIVGRSEDAARTST